LGSGAKSLACDCNARIRFRTQEERGTPLLYQTPEE
jgi:hypothetical protein